MRRIIEQPLSSIRPVHRFHLVVEFLVELIHIKESCRSIIIEEFRHDFLRNELFLVWYRHRRPLPLGPPLLRNGWSGNINRLLDRFCGRDVRALSPDTAIELVFR